MNTNILHQLAGNGNRPWREILQVTEDSSVTITHDAGQFVACLSVEGELAGIGQGLLPRDALNKLDESIGWYAHRYDVGGITVDDWNERMATGRYER